MRDLLAAQQRLNAGRQLQWWGGDVSELVVCTKAHGLGTEGFIAPECAAYVSM